MEADKPYFRIFERNELYIRMSRQHLKGIFGGIRLLGGTRPSAPPISAFMFKYIIFLSAIVTIIELSDSIIIQPLQRIWV